MPWSRALVQSVHCCLPEQAAVWLRMAVGTPATRPALPELSLPQPVIQALGTFRPRPPCAWRRGQSSLAAGFRSGRAGLSLTFSSWVTLGKSICTSLSLSFLIWGLNVIIPVKRRTHAKPSELGPHASSHYCPQGPRPWGSVTAGAVLLLLSPQGTGIQGT